MITMNIGETNRNPLNIRHSARNHWLGLVSNCPQRRGFCNFISAAHGYRAAVVLIKNYINRYGLDTPRKIIARWAPPSENQTMLYIYSVCGRCCLDPDQKISPTGPQIGMLVAAMARQETGMHITPEGVDEIRARFGV